MVCIRIAFALALLFAATGLSAQKMLSTYAGDGNAGLFNGDVSVARFDNPFGMVMDSLNNMWIADADNNVVRKIDAAGNVTTVAGTGVAGFRDGPVDSAQFRGLVGLCLGDNGDIYVSDFLNHRIRKISNGMVTTVAGTGVAGYNEGADTIAQFNYPRAIVRNSAGELFVADSWNHRIRKIATDGTVSTYAGGGTSIGVQSPGDHVDGADTSARFWTPSGLAIDDSDNLYVADPFNHRIRKIDTGRMVTTIAGSGPIGSGQGGFADGDTSTARLNTPTEVHWVWNTLLIADTYNNRVRELKNDTVVTLAGNSSAGFSDGTGPFALMNWPRGIATNGTLYDIYFVDHNNHAIRRIQHSPSPFREKEIFLYIEAWPNPTAGQLNISNDESTTVTLSLYNSNGKMIRQIRVRPGSNAVEFNELPAGSYFLKTTGFEHKFVINR